MRAIRKPHVKLTLSPVPHYILMPHSIPQHPQSVRMLTGWKTMDYPFFHSIGLEGWLRWACADIGCKRRVVNTNGIGIGMTCSSFCSRRNPVLRVSESIIYQLYQIHTECKTGKETGRVSSLGGYVTPARAGLSRYNKLG